MIFLAIVSLVAAQTASRCATVDCKVVSQETCQGRIIPAAPEAGACCPQCCLPTPCAAPPQNCYYKQTTTPAGQCPTCGELVCDECARVDCAAVKCAVGFVPQRAPGECCSKCVRDCSIAGCPQPVCGPGQELFTPPDSCCPTCRAITTNKCATVDCKVVSQETCQGRIIPAAPEAGVCCPQCCLPTPCAAPPQNCYYKQTTTPAGQCPTCGELVCDECARVDCAAVKCAAGFVPQRAPGECCSKCVRDCSLVDCAIPKCASGESFVPAGECCPVCRDECPLLKCAAPPAGCRIKSAAPGRCPTCDVTCSVQVRARAASLDSARAAAAVVKLATGAEVTVSTLSPGLFAFDVVGDATSGASALATQARDALVASKLVEEAVVVIETQTATMITDRTDEKSGVAALALGAVAGVVAALVVAA